MPASPRGSVGTRKSSRVRIAQHCSRSHAPAWECLPGRSSAASRPATQERHACIPTRERGDERKYSSPASINVNQSRRANVIAGTGIAPMYWVIHITALYRVMVYIFKFLPQHFLVLNKLGMAAFFPYLMFSVYFVAFLVESKLVEDSANFMLLEIPYYSLPAQRQPTVWLGESSLISMSYLILKSGWSFAKTGVTFSRYRI